jgi:parvulin-like peptidyl-prolyl isomerase
MARRLAAGEEVEKLSEELGSPANEESVTRREVSPQLGDAIFAAKPGEVVGPLNSGQGFVVFKIVEVKASDLIGYEEAKAGLRAQLETEAIEKGGQELREQLRARAHVDIRM